MKNNNYCIIMAGGVGSRVWPMSTPQKPKQFLDVWGTTMIELSSTSIMVREVCGSNSALGSDINLFFHFSALNLQKNCECLQNQKTQSNQHVVIKEYP